MVRVVEYKIKNESDFLSMIQKSKSCKFKCVETGEIISDKNSYNSSMKTFWKMVDFNDR